MKKFIITAFISLFFFSANAIALFPYFVDVAGNYNDGTPEPLQELKMYCKYWQTPKFYSKLKDADSFLNDVMPYSNASITRTESTVGDSIKIVRYDSPMLNGQTSTIYLVESPSQGFVIGYIEN